MTKEEFIEKARKVHGDKYDYSKVQINVVKDKVTIICPKHGEFIQEANSHLQKRGCPYCSGKKFSILDYLEKANKVWNNKYDYSRFVWKGVNQKVCIICPEHGAFWQLPNNHLKGECGCLECRGKSKDFKKLTSIEDVKERALEKFGNKFDLSEAVWNGSREKIKIICPDHGPFYTLPRQFLLNKYGCPKCNDKLLYTPEEYIEKCKETHPNEDYDYSKTVYKYSTHPVTIICRKHGEFYPFASQFINEPSFCPKCAHDSLRLSKEEFVRRSIEVHGNYYNYDKVNYINHATKVIITCPIHGDFEQAPVNHLRGCGCPKCALENKVGSKGEQTIKQILDNHNIKYTFQFAFDCKKLARDSNIIIVDFALKYNGRIYFIEYNGKQHYQYIPFFHSGGIADFEKQQRRDQVLREFCELYKDKVSLLEISYEEPEENIESMILNFINYNTSIKDILNL